MLHFMFRDGALGYDCVACGARCCKGLGFALAGSELVPLLARAPGLSPFMQLHDSAVHALTFSDGCWQLGQDGRCAIEVEHGHAAKPSTCRLFPVNRLLRAGERLFVDLQLNHCPLMDAREVPRRPGATVIRWDDVARDLEAAGDGALAGEAHLPPQLPDDWVAREAAIRDATATLEDAPDPLTLLTQLGGDGTTLGRMWRAWSTWLDLTTTEAALVVRPLALVLPSLRWTMLAQPGGTPYPRLVPELDRQLLAGALLATLSARAARRSPSLRMVTELWRGLPLIRELLTHWEAKLRLGSAPVPATMTPELATAWARLQVEARTRPIGEALTLAGESLPTTWRPLLLRLASDRVR